MPDPRSTPNAARHMLWLSIFTIWVWIGIAAFLNESQLNDSLEQFIWAQSLEWGYWKHPPVTSWLLYLPLHGLGPSPGWTYVLSALLYANTVLATHKIAELLFDADTATWAVVLLTLHYGFTRRAQLYNHNSVLIAFVAVTVLLTVYALRDQKTWQWMWVGLMAGLSTLVKYQALVAFLGVLVAIASAGKLKASARGLGWAGVVSVLTLTPHGLWLLEHDFKPVRYAMSFLADPDWMGTTQRQASFWVAQLRFHLPMLFFMALIGA